ncbi:hypothetical protein I8U93_004823, partial [Klebsiella oxytoca]
MKYQRSSELRHGAGFSTGRVRSCCTAWDTWLDPSSSYFARPYTLDYRKPDGTGHLEGLLITIPEAENLIQEEIIHDF